MNNKIRNLVNNMTETERDVGVHSERTVDGDGDRRRDELARERYSSTWLLTLLRDDVLEERLSAETEPDRPRRSGMEMIDSTSRSLAFCSTPSCSRDDLIYR